MTKNKEIKQLSESKLEWLERKQRDESTKTLTVEWKPTVGRPNANGIMYTEDAVKNAMTDYMATNVSKLVTLGYDTTFGTTLKNVCAEIKEWNPEDGSVVLEVLNTPKGKELTKLVNPPDMSIEYTIGGLYEGVTRTTDDGVLEVYDLKLRSMAMFPVEDRA